MDSTSRIPSSFNPKAPGTQANDTQYDPRAMSFQGSSFNKVPAELMRLIFSYLGVKDHQTLSLVCRNFKAIANDMKIWAAVARQLNIPLRKNDTLDVIKSILSLHEAMKKPLETYFEFLDEQIILKDQDTKMVIEELRQELKKFEEKYKGLDHPLYRKTRKELENLEIHKYPEEQLTKLALTCVLENRPAGAFCIFTSSANKHLIYKAADSKVYAFSTQRSHQIAVIYGHLLKNQIFVKGKIIQSLSLQEISQPGVAFDGKELKTYAQRVWTQFQNIPPHNAEQTIFKLPVEGQEGRMHVIEIEPVNKRVVLTQESKKTTNPGAKVPISNFLIHNEYVYRAVLEGSQAKDFLKLWKKNIIK